MIHCHWYLNRSHGHVNFQHGPHYATQRGDQHPQGEDGPHLGCGALTREAPSPLGGETGLNK